MTDSLPAMIDARKRRPHVLVALATAILCLSSVPVFLRHFAGALDAWTVNGFRYGVAALLWLPYVLRHRRDATPGRNPWRDAVVPAFVNAIGQIGWAFAPYYVEAGVMAFVIRISFLFTVVFGFAVLPGERPLARRPSFWAAVALSAAGLVAMYRGRGGGDVRVSAVGWLILLGTAVFWGLYSVCVRRCMRGHSIRLSFGIICIYTALPLVSLLFFRGNWAQLGHIAPGELALLGTSAVVGIAVAHVFLYQAIFALGPIVTDGASLATPFLTALGAALVLGERLSPAQWLGGSIIVAGSVLLVLGRQRLAAATPVSLR